MDHFWPGIWLILTFLSLRLLTAPVHAQTASPVSPSVETALSEIDSLRSEGQFETAHRRVDSLAEVHPRHVEIQIRKSLLHSDLGKQSDTEDEARAQFRRALEAADRALVIDSTHAWAHFVKALAEGRLTLHVGTSERVRRSRAVKRHADRAIALDSTIAPAYHLRGRWHREVASINFVKRALVKAFYGGLPDASVEQSVRDFQRAIALESRPYNHLELGKTYREMGRDDAAREQFQLALQTSGSPFDAEYKAEAQSILNKMD